MRAGTHQFVVLFGTLLSFANGGSLFAGKISLPEPAPITADSTTDIVTPAQRFFTDADDNSAGGPTRRDIPLYEFTAALPTSNESLNLLGTPSTTEQSGPRMAEPNGLAGGNGPALPAPQPSAPSRGGNACGMGMPNTISQEQQAGLPSSLEAPTPEAEGIPGTYYFPSIANPTASRLFRPPRER